MANKYIGPGIIKFCLLGLLSGCATTAEVDTDKHAGAELNDDSLDVLFATEFPVESEADALARAAHALQERDVDKALFFYVRALQFQPENIDLLVHIGEIQMRRRNYAMARQAFLTAASYDPNHARSHEGLGLIYMAQGRHEEAVAEFNMAVANDDHLWRTHNALGVYADKAEDFAIAQSHYDSALSINPDAAHVLNNRGYSKFLAGDVPGAAIDLHDAAEDGDFPLAWANLAKLYATQGRYDDAITTYKNVMSEAHAFNNTGHAAIENGDFTQAKRYLHEAIRLSPTYFPDAAEDLALLENAQ